jgi:uncharacterized DUF497 family protein
VASYEWDPNKAASNLVKHHISFETGVRVCSDPNMALVFSRFEHREERWKVIGKVGSLVLVVVCTFNESTTRIISVRRATPKEENYYAQEQRG